MRAQQKTMRGAGFAGAYISHDSPRQDSGHGADFKALVNGHMTAATAAL